MKSQRASAEFGAAFLDGVGHVLQEHRTQHHVHVVAGVDVGTQAVGRIPQALVQIAEELLFYGVHVGDQKRSSSGKASKPFFTCIRPYSAQRCSVGITLPGFSR